MELPVINTSYWRISITYFSLDKNKNLKAYFYHGIPVVVLVFLVVTSTTASI
jgi:hypothetical protein